MGLFLVLAMAVPAAADPVAVAQRRAVVRALEAALMVSGQEGGAIRMAVWAAALPVADGSWRLRVVTEIEGPPLAESGTAAGPDAAVDLFLYVLGDGNEVVRAEALHWDLEEEDHRERVAETGLRVPLALELPPGDYVLRLLARAAGGAFGVRSVRVSVPEEASAAAVLPPLLAGDDAGWLLGLPPPAPAARAGGGRAEEGRSGAGRTEGKRARSAGSHPGVPGQADERVALALDGGAVLPSALPVLRAGEPRSGFLLTRRRDLEGVSASLLVKHNELGVVERRELTGARPVTSPFAGHAVLAFTFDAAGLEPGAYSTVAELTGPGAEPLRSEPVVWIVAGADDPVVWTRLDAGRLGPARSEEARLAPARPELPGDPGGERPIDRPAVPKLSVDQLVAELEGGYRAALLRWVEGDRAEALGRLRELEETVVADPAGALAVLEEAEAALVERLAAGGWERLLPAVELHGEAADAYRRDRRFALAAHATRLAGRLAERYARALGTAEAARDAADALALLAGSLQRAGMPAAASGWFERSLTVDGAHPAALLGLAAIHERFGRYPRAVALLERLAELGSAGPEAELRRAINRGRLPGRPPDTPTLERLAAAAEPTWVAVVATQEVARLEIAAGDLPGAETRLVAALDRWPAEPALIVLLANLLDRQGRPREASRRLAELAPAGAAPAGSESARSRYNRWPEAALTAAERSFRRHSAGRLAALRDLLAGHAPLAGS